MPSWRSLALLGTCRLTAWPRCKYSRDTLTGIVTWVMHAFQLTQTGSCSTYEPWMREHMSIPGHGRALNTAALLALLPWQAYSREV